MPCWHTASIEGHIDGCLVEWSIVLLQFPVVSPLASMLNSLLPSGTRASSTSVLILCHSLVGVLGSVTFVDLFVCACHKFEDCEAMPADAHKSSNAMLGLATVPLLAGVHQLPAGLTIACSLKYLLFVILTLHQDQSSLLSAAFANLTLLASECFLVPPLL